MDDREFTEPTKATGLFGRVMADISVRAAEFRAKGSIGMQKLISSSENESLTDERLSELQGLPPKMWRTTFDSFDLSLAPKMMDAVGAARNFAAGTWKPWCLVLSGPYGCGKTHLAYAVANTCREKPRAFRFITIPALFQQLRESIDEKRRATQADNLDVWGPDEWVRSYSDMPRVLILDDLGAQQDTDWAAAQLFAILNARCDAKLPTMITTNLSREQFDPRLASRLSGGFIICRSPDLRGRFA